MDLLVRFAYLLGVLCLGLGGRIAGVLGEGRRDRLNAVAFYVALPALIFDSTYAEPLGELVSATLALAPPVVQVATVLLGWVLHRRVAADDRRSVAIVQSYHSNLGYLGVPIVATTLGGEAAATASVILGVAVLLQTPLSVTILTTMNDGDASLADEARRVLANPVVLALVLGLLASAVGLDLPTVAAEGLDLVSTTALPLALVLIGSALEPRLPEDGYVTLSLVVATKLLVMPALAFVAFTILGATPAAREVGVLMFAMPTAVATFVYAGELGGDERFASQAVFVTTVLSLALVFLLLGGA